MGYDRKYGRVTTEHGDIPEDEPVVVFRARDQLLPDILSYYMMLCLHQGSPDRHIDIVRGTFRAVRKWQAQNETKTPDSVRSLAWMTE